MPNAPRPPSIAPDTVLELLRTAGLDPREVPPPLETDVPRGQRNELAVDFRLQLAPNAAQALVRITPCEPPTDPLWMFEIEEVLRATLLVAPPGGVIHRLAHREPRVGHRNASPDDAHVQRSADPCESAPHDPPVDGATPCAHPPRFRIRWIDLPCDVELPDSCSPPRHRIDAPDRHLHGGRAAAADRGPGATEGAATTRETETPERQPFRLMIPVEGLDEATTVWIPPDRQMHATVHVGHQSLAGSVRFASNGLEWRPGEPAEPESFDPATEATSSLVIDGVIRGHAVETLATHISRSIRPDGCSTPPCHRADTVQRARHEPERRTDDREPPRQSGPTVPWPDGGDQRASWTFHPEGPRLTIAPRAEPVTTAPPVQPGNRDGPPGSPSTSSNAGHKVTSTS